MTQPPVPSTRGGNTGPAAGPPPHPSALAGAVAGVLTAAVAMGVGQLAAGLTVAQSSPVLAVGQAAIDLTPLPVKDFAISTFGANDKTALLVGILVILAAFAAVIGILAVRRLAFGLAGLGVFACIGLAAALTRPTATVEYVIPTLVGAAAGAFALTRLVRAAHGLDSRPSRSPGARAPASELKPPDLPGPAEATPATSFTFLPNPDDRGASRGPARRRFLTTSGVAVVTAAAGALVGRELITRHNVSAARAALRFPKPAVAAPPLPPGANLNIPGLSSFITPNGSFYRVDTALLLPQVDPATWQLRIHGMVQREVRITFDQLLRRPLIEDYITLTCVSDPVGGPYVGNARWLGASLAALLREARVKRGADQILSTSADGWTCGTPIQTVMDGRNALLAVAMNGQPLPVAHGFPARMTVPGLYGYVSATKWVVDLEITTFAAAKSYWVQRGYSPRAPIKTESRIDVPRPLAQVKAGRTAVAGVAWAPHRGIDAVQVRADDGPWNQARLAPVPGIDTWRQWVWEWDASPGLHTLQVRATDGTHATQPSRRVPIFPNGATGWDTVTVTVT